MRRAGEGDGSSMRHPAVAAAIADARREWPGIDVPAEVFAAWLEARCPPGHSLANSLGELHVADLYIACACCSDVPGALRAFEGAYFPGALRAAARGGARPDEVADVAQILREILFVPRGAHARPGLADYEGSSHLRVWLRVIAMRQTAHALRKARREPPIGDEALLESVDAAADPSLAYLRSRHLPEVKAALEQAVTGLSARDRTLLRAYYVDRSDLRALARLYGTSIATASRALDRARRALFKGMTGILRQELALRPAEVVSLLRQLESQLDLTLSRILA